MTGLGPYTCGLDAVMDVVGGKWKALILWALQERPHRFGELRREVPGISEKMLIQQLRELQGHGVVHRESYHEVPPRVEYSLTPLGASLVALLEPLGAWGDAHLEEIVARGAGSPGDPGAGAAPAERRPALASTPAAR
ncbi:winged helix-turn-helix transcriptional regulator [Allostreptomyces psammosilenae]|uniref:DNA-binding HxlR family transcriptional regulator n=1 Tax=Allostreptomyces psammosilenae TaxID=1892865 RepID=A0A853A0F9_9ACTN|nr:helix-turn-helix domain-containing protein [Allostreptomyces psammosilenae]NYI04301.1 DNA-binding HxlR family transcriptional regulator [Allostreptomyces psammosilenae]